MLWYWNKFLAGATAVLLLAGIGIEGAFAGTLEQNLKGCTLIDFEGAQDTIKIDFTFFPAATFSNAQAAVDSDAGGSTGNIANEPSPDTIMTPFFLTGFATVDLDMPVNEIRVFHSTNNQFGTTDATELRVFDASNIMIATVPLLPTPTGPGDPNGGTFGTWVQVIHTEPSAVIKKVQFGGFNTRDRTGYDNFEFCFPVSAIGGEISPTTTSALLLAGSQNMMAWMIPVIVSVIGFAIVIARKF